MVRGLLLWIVPAVLGSMICTFVGSLMTTGRMEAWPFFWSGAAASLWFTLGGSALLLLAFASLRPRRIIVRYAALLVLGFITGGAMMMPFGSLFALGIGSAYGLVTALVWVTLHKLLYGST